MDEIGEMNDIVTNILAQRARSRLCTLNWCTVHALGYISINIGKHSWAERASGLHDSFLP